MPDELAPTPPANNIIIPPGRRTAIDQSHRTKCVKTRKYPATSVHRGVPLSEQVNLTTGMIAKIMGVAPRTVAIWVDRGLLKGVRLPLSLDRRVYVPDLIDFCRTHGLRVPPQIQREPALVAVGLPPLPFSTIGFLDIRHDHPIDAVEDVSNPFSVTQLVVGPSCPFSDALVLCRHVYPNNPEPVVFVTGDVLGGRSLPEGVRCIPCDGENATPFDWDKLVGDLVASKYRGSAYRDMIVRGKGGVHHSSDSPTNASPTT